MSLRKIGLSCLLGLLAQFARADISAEISEASAPLTEGVPEVAVARLQALLNKDLPDTDWQIVAEKLAEAQVAAREPRHSRSASRPSTTRIAVGQILAGPSLGRPEPMG